MDSRAVLAYVKAHPRHSWRAIGEKFGVSATHAKRLVTQADAAYRKTDSRVRYVYTCRQSGCGVRFYPAGNYRGKSTAKYCPAHRGKRGTGRYRGRNDGDS